VEECISPRQEKLVNSRATPYNQRARVNRERRLFLG
jgi:hypothetical protein